MWNFSKQLDYSFLCSLYTDKNTFFNRLHKERFQKAIGIRSYSYTSCAANNKW